MRRSWRSDVARAMRSALLASLLAWPVLPAPGVLAAVPVGPEVQVNTYTTGDQRAPSVAASADGDFVVVWTSFGSSGVDTFYSIHGQRYASDGTALGSEFQVNTVDNCIDVANSVQIDADGDGCGNACDGDFDQNGVAGGTDFNTFRLCFAKTVPGAGPADDPTGAESDLDGDGLVGGADFNRLRFEFGTAPGPGSPSCL